MRAEGDQMHVDEDALQRFLTDRDESGFDELVRRHLKMVLHTCCQILRNMEDAEDAAQSTFLVLHRKAATMKRVEDDASQTSG